MRIYRGETIIKTMCEIWAKSVDILSCSLFFFFYAGTISTRLYELHIFFTGTNWVGAVIWALVNVDRLDQSRDMRHSEMLYSLDHVS